ncbi:hypothetical protein ATCC90586_002806 [Pythium insidiosum]|nr:hypothetical protein ATCC90586_002806 [Pythium insidiosum]
MLTLQIGQCGNQLGHALFQRLAEDDERATRSAFFRSPEGVDRARSPARRVARAVLIDMEPKVVSQCLRRATPSAAWEYDARNTFAQQSGSGNNWAFGYMAHGERHYDALHDLVQREAERCDLLHTVLALQSVAGGTGSGLGSFVTEHVVADALPHARVLNAIVWPYQSGEVIVQNYNAVLTMASLAAAADGVIVLQNDVANEICRRLLQIARPSFDEMNHVLATQLAAALLPLDATRDVAGALCEQLCTHPGFKLLDIKTIPQIPQRSKEFSTHTWAGLLKHLHQMQVANSPLEEGIDWSVSLQTPTGRARNRAIGSALLLRGVDVDNADVSAFQRPEMYAPWSLRPFEVYRTRRAFNRYDKTAALIRFPAIRKRSDVTKNSISTIKQLPPSLETLYAGENSITEFRDLSLPLRLQSIKERTLAKWTYGEVFVAQFVGKQKLVIKEMYSKYAKRETSSMRQFVDEIMLAAKLSHPHIVPFVGITLCDAISARGYACEFMTRGDLGTILSTLRGRSDYRRGFQWFGSRLSGSTSDFPRSKAELAMDLLDGLMYLHALDPPVMHHRLCSRIALVSEDYTLKLSLLGLPSRQRLHEMTDQTPWMAPEVLRGGEYDERAVVYAVGVILTELDTCEYPYRSGIDGFLPANPSMARIAIMVGAGSVQPMLQEECPGLIRSLVKRCLSFDRADRPTLRQVHDSVERLCRQSQLSGDES